MNSAEAIVIMQTLLSCRTLFSDFFPIPNYVTLTSFEYSSSDGITVQEWKNGSQGPKKKIKFQGKVIDTIQIQMFEKDGKMMLGGQVSKTKNQDDAAKCPVVGDMNELRLLSKTIQCDMNCFYRLNDFVYKISLQAGYQCLVFDLNGKDVRDFKSPPQLDCSAPYGFLPEEDIFVFMKNGECKQVDYSAPEASWAATSCPRREIELGPNKLSQYYHLRYLLTISGCGENVTDIGDPDNIYVRFMHKNETLIEPTEPPSTTVVVVTEERNIQEYLAYGLFSVVGFVVLVLVILGVIYRKKLLDKCRKKKEPSAPEKPAPDLATAEPLNLDVEPETARPKVKERDIAEDTIGNVDENLKSMNPMDVHLELQFKPDETFVDEKAKWTLPTIVNCLQPYRYCGFLGAGTFGRVYRYEVMSEKGTYVAIKFVKTDLKTTAMFDAKQEFMLIRQIQRKFKATDDYYLLRVVDVGKYPNFVFIVTPIYYRCMNFFMPTSKGFEKASIADILSVAWNYLKGIHQLHSVEYGHNDIKPGNFMQKDECENTIVLCDFGLVKRLGAKRKEPLGTPTFLPLTTFKLEVASNVDDHQSWLFLLSMMLTRSLLWRPDPKSKKVVTKEELHTQKLEFYNKLNKELNEKSTPETKLLCALSKAIITEHGPKNPVDQKKVISIMEEAQSTFGFKYATHEWWRIDYNPIRKEVQVPEG